MLGATGTVDGTTSMVGAAGGVMIGGIGARFVRSCGNAVLAGGATGAGFTAGAGLTPGGGTGPGSSGLRGGTLPSLPGSFFGGALMISPAGAGAVPGATVAPWPSVP